MYDFFTGRASRASYLPSTILHRRRYRTRTLKCRGAEYLRIIYGPEYLAPENLERLRARGLSAKRGLALRGFALGVEALERFVRREQLRGVGDGERTGGPAPLAAVFGHARGVMRIWVCDEKLCIKPLCRLELQEGVHEIVHTEMCPGGTTQSLTVIERDPIQDEHGGLIVEIRPGVRAMVLDESGNQVLLPLVRNPLVGHVWRVMLDWSIYRNWYRGVGAFVLANPDVRRFVDAYFREKDPVVAMGSLFSATERLLRAALKAEGVQGKILTATLPRLLNFCTSADRRYFNLPSMCCDVRSIFSINSIRIGIEHGDHRSDQRELGQAGWNPPDRDKAYLEIMLQRMLGRHSQVCRIFDEVDPETGLFLKNWEPREFAQCAQPGHDGKGRLPDEEPQAEDSPSE